MKKIFTILVCLFLSISIFVGGYLFAIHSVKGIVPTKDGYMIDYNGQVYDYYE